MATFVGTQYRVEHFLKALLELEYDAIEAYSAAIRRLADPAIQRTFDGFRSDHQRHVRELSDYLRTQGHEPPEGADAKALLTEGKVVIGQLVGDKGILIAMRSNERDTNTAYERTFLREDISAELGIILSRNLDDERRHQQWIEQQIKSIKTSARDLDSRNHTA
jgi:uncharacterized protein (TIGR02284 family)